MPFTPYHVGPHAVVGLLLYRHICIPTFVFSNVIVDLQPLLVLLGYLDTPLHGISHTFVGGGLLGLLFGMASIPLSKAYSKLFSRIRFPYTPSSIQIVLSGVCGAWLHVLTDAPIYRDILPFYPLTHHPLRQSLSYHAVANFCVLCLLVAPIVFYAIVSKNKRKSA